MLNLVLKPFKPYSKPTEQRGHRLSDLAQAAVTSRICSQTHFGLASHAHIWDFLMDTVHI